MKLKCIINHISVILFIVMLMTASAFAARADDTKDISMINPEAFGATPSDAKETANTADTFIGEEKPAGYESLPEDEYSEEIWREFFRLNPLYDDGTGAGLREGLEKMYLPYFSLTLPEYNYDNVFGGWEIAYFDEDTETFQSLGVYAYVKELYEGETEQTEEKYGWIAFNENVQSVYHPSFLYHDIEASVVDGDTLRLHISFDGADSMKGTFAYFTYQLHSWENRGTTGRLLDPYYEQSSSDRDLPKIGEMTFNVFENVGSSEPYNRTLVLDAYWDLSGSDLEEFCTYLENETLYWAAGSYIEGELSSLNTGKKKIAGLGLAIRQASCPHEDRTCTRIEGNRNGHEALCNDCGLFMDLDPHDPDETGICKWCGYDLSVTGRLNMVLNGRIETENYRSLPGTRIQPKSFKGYLPPSPVLVPEDGGDININYIPISYELIYGDESRMMEYDESFSLPKLSIPGYEHEGYMVI